MKTLTNELYQKWHDAYEQDGRNKLIESAISNVGIVEALSLIHI